ncbi:MAG TPA: AAA family ATPase, partial [Planctomycetota bacterium]|nr:AAA family ATPase [Planctomycetota bacterium]
MTVDVKQIGERVERESAVIQRLVEQIRQRLVGQDHLIRMLVTGLLSGGHVLLEGVPGLAKTLSVGSLASAIDAVFQRIQ